MRKVFPIVMLMAAAYSTHAQADEVTCESKSQKRVECNMDTRGEVRIVKQLSKGACIEGETWGLSKHSVWVDKGCRAVFASRIGDRHDGGRDDDDHRHGDDRRDGRDDDRRDDGRDDRRGDDGRDDRSDDRRDDRRDDGRDDRRDDRRDDDSRHGGGSRIAFLNAKCPGRIEVHADTGGPVYINGKQAQFEPSNENYYEATGGGVTISVSRNTDGSQAVSYSGPGRANGVCQVTSD